MNELLIAGLVLLAYLLGSVSGSLLLGRWRNVDIRTQGSGNAGGTNALRTQGWKFALGVVLIDIGKGALAAWIGAHYSSTLGFVCGIAAVIGHVWPIYHGFRGGKGAATLVGALAYLWPQSLIVLLGVWVLCLISTGYVGLSTILAGFGLLVSAYLFKAGPLVWGFSAFSALFLLFTHRSNVQKMLRGNENRFEKARVLKRLFHSKKP
jgi:acyl phosphate:glycerol-3-phosphate acyltransferase